MSLGWLGRLSPRRWVQTVTLLASNAYFFSWLRFIPCSYLNCSQCALATFKCPLIAFQTAGMVMGMFGALAPKTVEILIVSSAVLLLFGAALGTWACGWLCPFGFVQDLLAKIPVPKFTLPAWVGWVRLPLFVVLLLWLPYATKSLLFCHLCPPGAIVRLSQQGLGIPLFLRPPEGLLAAVSVAVLLATLVLAVFSHRFFCTAVCPIGGVYGLFNKFSGFHLKVDAAGCNACGKCARRCPQGLRPHEVPNHSACSRCLECTGACEALSADVRI